MATCVRKNSEVIQKGTAGIYIDARQSLYTGTTDGNGTILHILKQSYNDLDMCVYTQTQMARIIK